MEDCGSHHTWQWLAIWADTADSGGNGDPWLTGTDFLFVLANWGTSGPGDFTGPGGTPDGIVNILEVLAILAAWGPC